MWNSETWENYNIFFYTIFCLDNIFITDVLYYIHMLSIINIICKIKIPSGYT